MVVTVRAIMVDAVSIFVNVCFSSSILIIFDNVRRVRVKLMSIDEPLTMARAFRPKSLVDGSSVRLMSIDIIFMVRIVFVLLYINSRPVKAGDML